MTIELAQIEAIPQIKKIFKESISAICAKDYSGEQLEAWASKPQDWEKSLSEQYFLVAKKGTKILGFASLRGNDYLNFLFVHKDFQRQGIAQSLFSKIEEEAIARKTKILKSDVSLTAKAFFEKNGFKKFFKQQNNLQGVEIINYGMGKILHDQSATCKS